MKQTSEHTVLTVHTGEVIQEDYKGPGAVYHGYLFQPDAGKRVYTGEQCRTELDRVRRMGIRLVRTYYNYDMVWYKGEWNWESPAMTGFYRWLGELKEMGVKVIVNAAWNCPGDINSSHSWPWAVSPITVQGDWEASVQRYAWFISESVRQMIELRGFTNVEYLCMFTEPQRPGGRMLHAEPSYQWKGWRDCVKAAHERLVADNRRHLIKMVGPDEGSTATSVMLEWVTQNADEYIDIYSSHNYDPTGEPRDTYDDWCAWASAGEGYAKKTGKPYWFDEYGTFSEEARRGDWYGTLIAIAQTAFMNSGVQASLLWTLFDQQWPNNYTNNSDSFHDGEHRCGIAPTLRQSGIPHKAYYSFSLITRYFSGENSVVYKTSGSDGLHLAALKRGDGVISILVVNSNQQPKSFSLQLPGMSQLLYRHLYDPAAVIPDENADLIPADRTIAAGNGFTDELPAGGVAVYTSMKE